MEYTAVIRTLGTAGEKYQCLLDSLVGQTIKPAKIIVYIAEGYPIPTETVGVEEYVYVQKGMVAQRALDYKEVDTEFILFLDDDLQLGCDAVENMYNYLVDNDLDVISPDMFRNNARPLTNELMMSMSGRMRPRFHDDGWGYKVMRSAGYSYRKRIGKDVYRSETNAGAAFLCRKEAFLKIGFKEERWLDAIPYSLGDDQTMYYKMHLRGLKIGTLYNHSFRHLDAGGNLNPEKEARLIYSDFWFKTIFWHRFILSRAGNWWERFLDRASIAYSFTFAMVASLVKLRFDVLKIKVHAVKDGVNFIRSAEYKALPKV